MIRPYDRKRQRLCFPPELDKLRLLSQLAAQAATKAAAKAKEARDTYHQAYQEYSTIVKHDRPTAQRSITSLGEQHHAITTPSLLSTSMYHQLVMPSVRNARGKGTDNQS